MASKRMQPHQPYQRPMPTASPKSRGVAAILSLLIPGLGHLYTGNPVSAIFWFVSALISAALLAVVIGFVLLPLCWVCSPIHAYISADNFNRRHNAIR